LGYIRPKWRSGFKKILSEAGLFNGLNSVHDAGSDLLFLAQNLRFLKSKGKLGLILPDGLIAGERFSKIRQILLNEHRIDHIVQLPRHAFSKADAQTHLVVVSKEDGPTDKVSLQRLSSNGRLSATICVIQKKAVNRLDYQYHFERSKQMSSRGGLHNFFEFGSIVESITRGNISSSEIEAFGFPVFHLNDFPKASSSVIEFRVPRTFRVSKRTIATLPPHTKVAEAGDLLVARVGRNLQEKICYVSEGNCIISDCIFKIKIHASGVRNAVAYLSSSKGRSALNAISHGVGAKYLSQSDILSLLIPYN
jgi:type I restriction enzyme M protein